MKKLSIALALSVIFAEALFAASATKLEKEAAEKEEFVQLRKDNEGLFK